MNCNLEQFASDNNSGICPEALEYMIKANLGSAPAYGNDEWTSLATDYFRKLFEIDCEVFFVFNGTAANSLSLAALCQSYHSVICHENAHIETDECGAPEFASNGSKLLLAKGENDKLSAEAIEAVVNKRADIHYPKPKVISLTQATELGTLYSIEELVAIKSVAQKYNLKIHMDGARFANAVVAMNKSPAEISWKSGVDVLCFCGTKNGMALGEAIIFFNKALAEDIDRVKKALPRIQSTLPPGLNLAFLFDQSIFVKASIQGVLKEGLIAGCLTALMILIFLVSWRSTVIVAVSIPLSMLVSIIVMSRLGQTFNIMTLGGLSLAVGILVDDATVEIENIHRNLGQGKPIKRAILDGAQQIATPALVATLCICIVFVPVVFLSGVAKYLFVSLAMAVVFAMLASYVLSRTVVPTMANYFLPHEADWHRESEDRNGHSDRHHIDSPVQNNNGRNNHHIDSPVQNNNGHGDRHQTTATTTQTAEPVKKDWIWRLHEKFNRQFEKFRSWYYDVLTSALNHRRIVFVLFGAFIISAGVLLPFVGQDFFPEVDGGQFSLHVRALPGTRLEETERIVSQVEDVIRQTVPKENLSKILDNIGLPNSGINLTYGYNGATIGPADADILVSLKESGSTFSYVKKLRQKLKATFPNYTFFFEPADIVTQILNFGLPAAVDVQISGPQQNSKANFKIAKEIEARMTRIPGAVDVHMQQVVDAPELRLDVDRTEAQQLGMTQRDVANSVLTSLSSSGQSAINQWLDPKKGVSYTLAVQVPQYKMDSIDSLKNTPVGNGQTAPQLLGNLASVKRDTVMQVVNHYNIQPVYDIYANSSDRDLGGVARDVNRIIADYKKKLPKGSQINVRGQVQTMNSSFLGLGLGLVFAIVLVYCLMVVNFQSWLDPLIIMMALPSALAGIVWMLFVTRTTFSVPSLMGAIMSIGVATSNSILMITFANDQPHEGQNAYKAAQAAGHTRLRPVLMTALAMLIGMVPMSLGLGEGGEQNAPLGRAVIGGLSAATVATLIFVPVVYSILRRQQPRPVDEDDDDLNFSDPQTEYSLSSSRSKS